MSMYVLRFPKKRVTATLQAPSWQESEHPRGQPENAGEFAEKSGETASDEKPSAKDANQSEYRQSAKASFSKMINDNKHISSMQRRAYEESMGKVLDNFSDAMISKIMPVIGQVDCYQSVDLLTDEMFPGSRHIVGGVWEWWNGEPTGVLHIDGRSPGLLPEEIYSHELGHALDFQDVHSSSPEWKKAWAEEVNVDGDPLSKYARQDESEGFAEFTRLIGMGQAKTAEEYFPACYACFKKWEYV